MKNYLLIFLFIIIILITVILVAKNNMERKIAEEIEHLMDSNYRAGKNELITEAELKELPKNVEKWLKNVGVLGKEKIKKVKLEQSGEMKLKKEQKNCYQAQAEQYIRVDQPGYLWQVDLPILPFINTKGRDLFLNAEGSMLIKIAYLIPVVDQKANLQINESSLHRFLLELPWYPTAALNDYLSWEKINANRAKATINYQGLSVSAFFDFDENGNLLKNEAMRFKENTADAERIRCLGEMKNYEVIDGLKIPTAVDVSWYLEGEKFTWYKINIDKISFSS